MAKFFAIKKLKDLTKLVTPKILVPVIVGACLLTVGIVLPSKPTSLKKNPYDTSLPHQITVPKVTKLTKTPTPSATSSAPTPAPTTTTPTTIVRSSTPTTTPAPATAPSPGTGVSGLSSSSSGSGGSNTSGSSSQSSPSSYQPSVSYSSENWSGYLTTTGSFSTVSADWVVPSATGSGSVSADASWIGIGGVSSSDLIQVGTQNTVQNGQVSSSAFYELLPATAQNITSMTVSAGDAVSANITEISAGEWSITITNETNKESFSTDVAYSSSNSSAEWIEEDPSFTNNRLVPFDDYGSVSFSNCLTTDNGTSENVSASSGDPVTMVNRTDQDISVPSALTNNGSNFSVSWQSPG